MFHDLRFGVRMLLKNPGFTAVAVLSLALGIGANTEIFQLVNAVRLKTLPVSNPQQLVNVGPTDMDAARGSKPSPVRCCNQSNLGADSRSAAIFSGIWPGAGRFQPRAGR